MYKLKREYEAEERRKKLLEQLKAKKDFRKMLKSYRLPSVLQQEADYDQFYNAPNPSPARPKPSTTADSEDVFLNDQEAVFYKEDVEFMRFHKRTSKNVQEALQGLIDSSKQTVQAGIKQRFRVSLNYVQLNRSCSVVNAWWSLNRLE
jgi:hypothetical protein